MEALKTYKNLVALSVVKETEFHKQIGLLRELNPRKTLMERMDELECFLMENFQPVKMDLDHTFTPGLYTRKIFMPAGTCVTSKIHRTEHQFAVLQGSVTVWNGDEPGVIYKAGDSGTTYPGTRRRLWIHGEFGKDEACIWMTMHATSKTTVEEVEADILEPYVNKLLVAMNESKKLK